MRLNPWFVKKSARVPIDGMVQVSDMLEYSIIHTPQPNSILMLTCANLEWFACLAYILQRAYATRHNIHTTIWRVLSCSTSNQHWSNLVGGGVCSLGFLRFLWWLHIFLRETVQRQSNHRAIFCRIRLNLWTVEFFFHAFLCASWMTVGGYRSLENIHSGYGNHRWKDRIQQNTSILK